ncbi:6853_t:CDS:2 [Acaulospora morrowiae]|uniref:6853_t:CDS:1 n=1 Tax=Acaulospora morrowiae TaxID=94023 RepID=A0A9N8VX78_9GLOM|nr:6853_t:CDS:2 [Acaulospora morrowiae]
MSMSYDPNKLTWNETHTINEEHQYCYCGEDRNLTEVSVQCCQCLNWFHAKCIKASIDKTIPIFTNYRFICKFCNELEGENFKRSQAGWKEIGGCAIANLMLQQHMADHQALKGDSRYLSKNYKKLPPFNYYFNKNDHLRPFVDKNWSSLCTERSRTATWWATLGSCLYSTKDLFVAKDEHCRSASSNFCLVDPNLWNIRPGHFGTSHSRNQSRLHKESTKNNTRTVNESETQDDSSQSIVHASSSKRQITPLPSTEQGMTPPAPPMQSNPKNTVIALIEANSSNTEFGQSGEQNNLRHGFKYLPCQSDVFFPYMQYRNSELPPYGVRLSKEDASLSVWISGDQLTTTTEYGFSMARANCPVKEGNWFYEVFIDRGGEGKIDGKDGAHVRVGWARREGNRNSSVGSDAYSYGFRDLTGHKVHQSRLSRYGEPFKTGDVIGLYISLPPLNKGVPDYKPKCPKRHRIPILFKGDTIFEYKDFKPTNKMNDLLELPEKKKTKNFWWQQKQEEAKNSSTQPPPIIPKLPGSKIIVYKNGVCQGVAFEDLYSFFPMVDERTNEENLTEDDGSLGYYPAVSMFRGGTCTLNFGPYFRYPPQPDPEAERYMEYIAEDVLYDIIDEIELWDWMISKKKRPRPATDVSDSEIIKKIKLDDTDEGTPNIQ